MCSLTVLFGGVLILVAWHYHSTVQYYVASTKMPKRAWCCFENAATSYRNHGNSVCGDRTRFIWREKSYSACTVLCRHRSPFVARRSLVDSRSEEVLWRRRTSWPQNRPAFDGGSPICHAAVTLPYAAHAAKGYLEAESVQRPTFEGSVCLMASVSTVST